MATNDDDDDGMMLRAEDGLVHIVKREVNRGFNGWEYYFECGDDVAYNTKGTLTKEAPTCLQCIEKQDGCTRAAPGMISCTTPKKRLH